eukprot:1144162-Pelagomonas_calceolata.AAC.5
MQKTPVFRPHITPSGKIEQEKLGVCKCTAEQGKGRANVQQNKEKAFRGSNNGCERGFKLQMKR